VLAVLAPRGGQGRQPKPPNAMAEAWPPQGVTKPSAGGVQHTET